MAADMQALAKSPLYSEELGIDLARNTDGETFKWFLASLLFGARISGTIAGHTYQAFARHKLLTPRAILRAGWDFLVYPVMREGGYVRYDEKTSTKILKDCEYLLAEYGGSLRRLHERALNSRDLEALLLRFYGVGAVTVNIFLRELRPYWEKSNPDPLPGVLDLARRLNLDLSVHDRKSLVFVRIEAGLIRMGKGLRKTAIGGSARESRP